MTNMIDHGAGKGAGMVTGNWRAPFGAHVSRATQETAERATRNANREHESGMIEPQKKSGPNRCSNTRSGPTPSTSHYRRRGDVSMPDQDTASTHPSAPSADLARRALAHPGLYHVRAVVALLVPAGEIVPPRGAA